MARGFCAIDNGFNSDSLVSSQAGNNHAWPEILFGEYMRSLAVLVLIVGGLLVSAPRVALAEGGGEQWCGSMPGQCDSCPCECVCTYDHDQEVWLCGWVIYTGNNCDDPGRRMLEDYMLDWDLNWGPENQGNGSY